MTLLHNITRLPECQMLHFLGMEDTIFIPFQDSINQVVSQLLAVTNRDPTTSRVIIDHAKHNLSSRHKHPKDMSHISSYLPTRLLRK
jgi:hypothetical protein